MTRRRKSFPTTSIGQVVDAKAQVVRQVRVVTPVVTDARRFDTPLGGSPGRGNLLGATSSTKLTGPAPDRQRRRGASDKPKSDARSLRSYPSMVAMRVEEEFQKAAGKRPNLLGCQKSV